MNSNNGGQSTPVQEEAVSECQFCERGKHEECEGLTESDFCDCPCATEWPLAQIKWGKPTYADNPDFTNEAKREQADLAYKAMRENR